MNKKCIKKIILGIVILILSVIYFGITSKSNAANILETWDVSADDGVSNVTATLYDDGKFVIEGTGSIKNYMHNKNSRPYENKISDIKNLEIKNGVTSIGNYAFYSCSELTGNLVLPEGLTSIGKEAFQGCIGLKGELVIPEGVTSIGDYAFYGCNSLTGEITIPEKVINIGIYVFSGCSGLTNIKVSSNNKNYNSEEGILFNKEKTELIQCPLGKQIHNYTIPNSVTNIGTAAFFNCSGLTGNLVIPQSVKNIGFGAFYNCGNIKGNLVIPEGVTCIESCAFRGCYGLNGKLVIPEGVTSIGERAFSGCIMLSGKLVIPKGVKKIGEYAFWECRELTGDLIIPDGLDYIKEGTFYGCRKLTGNLIIPESVTSIGKKAFYNCEGLKGNLIMPEGITSIGDEAFYSCSGLTGNLIIPKGVTDIGKYAFFNCKGLSGLLEIPEGVTSIKEGTFSRCSDLIGNLVIPESVKDIGMDAFQGCSCLTGDLIIPESVTSIGKSAFANCRGLTDNLIIPEGVTSIGENAFYKHKKIIAVADTLNEIQEIELPSFIKRTKEEGDILYTDKEFILENCELIDEGKKIKINYKNLLDGSASLKVNGGILDGVSIEILQSGTITYNQGKEVWLNNSIIATLHITEGEKIINNNEYNTYTFTENGEFIFKYLDINNEEKEVIARVDNIDKQAPIIKKVEGNPTEWTRENVTLVVDAEENLSSVVYSFDGGITWQTGNKKTYTENTDNIVIIVQDTAGNKTTYEPISITKIKKMKLLSYEEIEVDNKKYIERIIPNTSIKKIKENIETNGIIKILKNDQEITSENDLICTGMTIKVSWDSDEELYTTIVTGDLTGNGKMGIGDLSKLSRYAAGMDETLSGAYLRASDVVKDGKYGRISDISKMSRVLAGMDNL